MKPEFVQMLSEQAKQKPKDSKQYTQSQAAKKWGISTDNVIWTNRIANFGHVWINDETSELLYAKMKGKEPVK